MVKSVPFLDMLAAIFPIYAMIAAGWVARRLDWVKPASDSSVMKIAVEITLPCFILANLLGNDKLRDVGFALSTIGIGMAGILTCLCTAWLAAKIIRLKTGEGLRTFIVTTGSHNYGFFLIALVSIIYAGGGDMMGIMITHNVGCDIIYWSIGFLLISNESRVSLKFLLRGPVWSVFLGLFLIWSGAAQYVPDSIKNFLSLMGNCAIPLNLMIFGTLMFDMIGREHFSLKILSTAVLVRMGILPALYMSAAALLPVDISLKMLLVFQGLAPCGVMSAVLARHFGGFPKIAVQIILATSVVSIITTPIFMYFGMSLIGAE